MASVFSIGYQYPHPPLQKRHQIKITKFAAADLIIAAAFTFAVPTSSLADAITSSSDSSAATENDIQAVIDGVSPVSRTAGYTHTTTAEQNGITFTADWNDVPAGSETTFHVARTEGSSSAKARMDVPTYWDAGERQHCWVTQWRVHLKLCRLSSQIQSPHRYRRQVSYGVSALGRDHTMDSRSGLQLARVQCSSLRTPSLGCPRERARSSRHLPLLPYA